MRRILTFVFSLVSIISGFAWSSKGHQVVASIARHHLSAKTAEAIDDILHGNSIVYYASWLDQVVNTPEYSYTATWHYFNVDPGQDYEHRTSLAYTDAITALGMMTEVLRNPSAKDSDRELAVKVIVHVIGDIHQPMHAGHGIDSGGNTIRLYFLDKSTNLHSVWDYNMVESAHGWTYYQWQQYLDVLSEDEVDDYVAGSLDDWARESVTVAGWIYDSFPPGSHINTTDIEEWTPIVENQLLKGGLRLATYLNSIFDQGAGLNGVEVDTQESTSSLYDIFGRSVSPSTCIPGIYVTTSGQKIMIR